MSCADVDDLSGAIALGAIPPDEWPAIREHLATCTRGHPEIDQLQRTATLLLEAAPPIDPPAGLRDRILTAARAEAASDGSAPAPLTPVAGPIAPPATVIRRTDRAWWANPAWAAAAAAVLVAGALAVWNVTLRRDLNQTEDQLATAERQVSAGEQALAVLAGRGTEFNFTATLPGAGGTVLRPESGTATLVVHGLPQTQDRIYQVWALKDGQPTSLGVFDADASGEKVVLLDDDLQDADAVAITIEPAPQGSPLPTSNPILVAPLRG